MNLLKANSENIKKAAEIIKCGGLAAFPTETVYGLGADGFNSIAVSKIFEAKQRPSFNPLILHISSIERLQTIAFVNDERISNLVNEFWPGPLTIVLPKRDIVPDIVTAGNDTVAVRMPNHPTALELIERAGVPIAAPSANAFGKLSPTTAAHVKNQLGDKVDIILDGGQTSVGVESTIIKYDAGDFILLRPGGLPKEEIEKAAGKLKNAESAEIPDSPGQLFSHYSPNIPIKFYSDKLAENLTNKKIGLLKFKRDGIKSGYLTKYLSENGNLREAAANLFVKLHEFENENIDLILVERVPVSGLGIAIMDRLTKATNKYLGVGI